MADENTVYYLQAFCGKSPPVSSIHAEKTVLISSVYFNLTSTD